MILLPSKQLSQEELCQPVCTFHYKEIDSDKWFGINCWTVSEYRLFLRAHHADNLRSVMLTGKLVPSYIEWHDQHNPSEEMPRPVCYPVECHLVVLTEQELRMVTYALYYSWIEFEFDMSDDSGFSTMEEARAATLKLFKKLNSLPSKES